MSPLIKHVKYSLVQMTQIFLFVQNVCVQNEDENKQRLRASLWRWGFFF